MGINVGKVTGQEVGTYRGLENVRMLQVELLGDNPDTVLFFNVSGEDTAPVNGDMVIVHDMGGFRMTLGIKDPIVLGAAAGEKKLYSRDSAGAIKSFIHLKADGSIDISAPAGLNITADTNIIGTLTVSKVIKGLVDIIADYAATAITLLTHFSTGNLGYPTGTPIQSGGGTTPGSLPTTDASGDLITGGGVSLDNHDHDYTWTDPAGNGTTDPPN